MTSLLPHLEKLLAAATPGPWSVRYAQHDRDEGGRPTVMGVYGPPRTVDYGMGPEQTADRIIETDAGYYDPKQPDADLIVAAVNALPQLLALARAAEALTRAHQVGIGYHPYLKHDIDNVLGDKLAALKSAIADLEVK